MSKNFLLLAVIAPLMLVFAGALTLSAYGALGLSLGQLQLAPAPTITVTGSARSQERTQIAQFSAGVMAMNVTKETAVAEVEQKMNQLNTSLKEFGIPAEDLKTQNVSIYQDEKMQQLPNGQRSTPGDWRVNNTVDIKLRDVDRAPELLALLSQSGATNVYGPNFMLDESDKARTALLESAIKDAREKADVMAKGTGRTIKRVVTVQEGFSGGGPVPMYAMERGAGGGGPLEPGTSTVEASVTVTFELN